MNVCQSMTNTILHLVNPIQLSRGPMDPLIEKFLITKNFCVIQGLKTLWQFLVISCIHFKTKISSLDLDVNFWQLFEESPPEFLPYKFKNLIFQIFVQNKNGSKKIIFRMPLSMCIFVSIPGKKAFQDQIYKWKFSLYNFILNWINIWIC